MKKLLLFIALFSCTQMTYAHQAEVSSLMLIEQSENTWLIQVRSALTAFQYEIKTHYADTPYTSPEEFEAFVLDHLEKNIAININGQNPLSLKNGQVKLGHETSVVFEVVGVPEEIQSLSVENNAFSTIHRSQSAFMLLKNGFEKKQLILNKNNQYSTQLRLDGEKIVEINQKVETSIISGLIPFKWFFLISLALFLLYRIFIQKKILGLKFSKVKH